MPLIAAALLTTLLLAPGLPDQDKTPPAPQQEGDGKKKKKDDGQKADEKKSEPEFRLDDHPSIHFGKGTHLDFRARFSGDWSDSEAPSDDPTEVSSIDLGKKRIGVSGEIRNVFEFQVEAELQSDDPWRDVYGEVKYFDFARVRGGKFKVPFSYDENTGASRLDFMFRSLAATQLAPGRDQGVMVHGRVLKKVVGYEAGFFQHDGKNARTNNPDKVFGDQTLAGRVTVEPLRNRKDAPGDLIIGVAFTRSDVPEGISGVRGQTVLQQNFFSGADFIVNGQRRRTGVEFAFLPGPATIKGEWMRLQTERLGESVEDTDLSPIVGEGWYVSGTYAITGEKKANVDKPKRPLLRGGFGAIEVGARIESLRFKSGRSNEQGSTSPRADVILGNRDQVTTLGVNWFPVRFVKVQFNFFREKLDDPSQGPLPSKASFSTRAIRIQFSL